MIKVERLTKTYKLGKRKITPISNVSFTLGDTGFVFITGKSGSGKSFFLKNLIVNEWSNKTRVIITNLKLNNINFQNREIKIYGKLKLKMNDLSLLILKKELQDADFDKYCISKFSEAKTLSIGKNGFM